MMRFSIKQCAALPEKGTKKNLKNVKKNYKRYPLHVLMSLLCLQRDLFYTIRGNAILFSFFFSLSNNSVTIVARYTIHTYTDVVMLSDKF